MGPLAPSQRKSPLCLGVPKREAESGLCHCLGQGVDWSVSEPRVERQIVPPAPCLNPVLEGEL